MPIPSLAFALALQTVLPESESQSVKLVLHREIRGYSLCDSFSDPAPGGRATACRASGGGAELDAAVCRRVRVRARFTPALDLRGTPVSAVVQWTIDWRIPPAWNGDEYPQPPIP